MPLNEWQNKRLPLDEATRDKTVTYLHLAVTGFHHFIFAVTEIAQQKLSVRTPSDFDELPCIQVTAQDLTGIKK